MTRASQLRVLLVDPSLFTAPYDAALTEGLLAAGVRPTWAARPVRKGDRQEIAAEHVDPFFYVRTDELSLPRGLRALAKGLAHGMGLTRLIGRVWRQQPDVVHFQWLVVPLLDACAIAVIQKACPVVVTIHDSVQYNGDRLSLWQRLAFLAPLRWASRVVVHTQSARTTLIGHGIPAEQIRVIPHGALSLRTAPTASPRTDPRWTFTAFGEIKPYKGLDLLVEAIALLDEAALSGVRVIIAGRPRMDLAPLLSRIAALGLSDVIDVRPRRLTEDEMAKLFGETDCFVFPYRQIDASGVYSLVKSLGRWIVATRIGIFAEDLEDGARGELIPPEDVGGLSRALAAAVGKCPTPTMISASAEWLAIGKTTRALYCEVSLERPQSAVTGGPLRRIRARGQDSPIPGPRAGISHGEH